ncbi:MAG: cytochrome c3 family protein [Polyangiaceae bacterium]
MRWTRAQRWSAVVLIALIVVNAHVALPLTASRIVSLALLLGASVHVAASLFVMLTDYRVFAERSKILAGVLIALGAGAAIYGSGVILRAPGPAPIPGHLEGSECERCHERDPHKRWSLKLHGRRGDAPGLACEDCHSVTVKTPKLLARLDPQLQQHVGVATPIDLCLECHTPKWAAGPVWPGAIHGEFRCGTCHSRVEKDGEPSWKRACHKCHPRQEDVHKDVTALDTTFTSAASEHDIHTLRCSSCHAEMK